MSSPKFSFVYSDNLYSTFKIIVTRKIYRCSLAWLRSSQLLHHLRCLNIHLFSLMAFILASTSSSVWKYQIFSCNDLHSSFYIILGGKISIYILNKEDLDNQMPGEGEEVPIQELEEERVMKVTDRKQLGNFVCHLGRFICIITHGSVSHNYWRSEHNIQVKRLLKSDGCIYVERYTIKRYWQRKIIIFLKCFH